MTRSNAAEATVPDHEVVIIGAGFSGIGTGIRLLKDGIEDFVILDRGDDVGGTWRDNTYPGVAVDVPSFMYQYSFEMNPNWKRAFAEGHENHAYVQHCVEKYGLAEHLRFGVTVESARFDEASHRWRVSTDQGDLTSRYIVNALGLFGEAVDPPIRGLHDFARKVIHTSRWDHEYDLTGKRVAVIGTGPSAVQLVPAIAPHLERLDVYQRTPVWVAPRPNPPLAPVRPMLKHLPGAQWTARMVANTVFEIGNAGGLLYNKQLPWLVRGAELACRGYLRTQVRDPKTRRALTPDYALGCKRPVISNHYWKTFNRDNTNLVTSPIESITPTGVRTADGVEREIDVLVLATGFKVFQPENSPPFPIVGRHGTDLGTFWNENRFQAYQGITIPNFPNYFTIFGPYGLAASWPFMVENQSMHASRVIREAHRRGATSAEVRQEPHDAYFEQTQRRMKSTTFLGPRCATSNTYYINDHGDAPGLRPATFIETWWRARHFPLENYEYADAATEPSAGSQASEATLAVAT